MWRLKAEAVAPAVGEQADAGATVEADAVAVSVPR